MGIQISSIQNETLRNYAYAIDGNTEKLKESVYDEEEMETYTRDVTCTGNNNGVLDNEEIGFFMTKIQDEIEKKKNELVQLQYNEYNDTKPSQDASDPLRDLYTVGSTGLGFIIGGLKNGLKGGLIGGAIGLVVGLIAGSFAKEKYLEKNPNIENYNHLIEIKTQEIEEIKEEYNKIFTMV